MEQRLNTHQKSESSLPLLVEALKQVEMSDEIAEGSRCSDPNDHRRYLTNGVPDELHPMIQKVVQLADTVLITPSGECFWYGHQYLRGFGYNVTKGEGDSHGWLTGCIHTKKGIIVYG